MIITGALALAIFFCISIFAMQFGDYVRADSQKVSEDGYLFDANSKLTASGLQRLIESGATPEKRSDGLVDENYGTHWLWVYIDSISSDLDILQVELAWLDILTIHLIAENGDIERYRAGDDQVFGERAITFRKPAFNIRRDSGDSQIAFVLFELGAQGKLSLPMTAISQEAFDRQRDLDHLFYGAVIAILLALGIYNATIFFGLRENVHFYYMAYIFIFGFLQIIASGIGQQYLWPNSTDTSSLLAHIFLALTNFSITYFVIHFISLEKYSRSFSYLLQLFAHISLLCVPLLFVIDYYPIKTVLHSCSFVIMCLIFPASIYTSMKGNEVAHFLLASNIVLFPSVAIGLLRFLGQFESAYWAEHLAELGIVAEAIILSAGLAYRVNLLRNEKEKIALARETERTAFAHQLFASREQERRNIGKALHDSLGHKILSVKTSILGQHKSVDDKNVNHQISIIDEAIEEVRDLSHLLYPSILDHLGLKKSVASLLDKALTPTALSYSLDMNAVQPSRGASLLIYRASQECINNLIRHSDASSFSISIWADGQDSSINFEATDNGSVNIIESRPGFGLTMLEQQVAVLDGEMQILRTSNNLNKISLRFHDTFNLDTPDQAIWKK